MLVIREVLHCKPGKVRPLVEKFLALGEAVEKAGQRPMRIMTDVSAERYWTLVAELEVDSLEAFQAFERSDAMKEMDSIMEGYHDLVDQGRREIYQLQE